MTVLHELLAVEKGKKTTWNTILTETLKKFGNSSTYFRGSTTRLAMIARTPENERLEMSEAKDNKMPTTVALTLGWALDRYVEFEKVEALKHHTNLIAKADVVVGGNVWFSDVPAPYLLGLLERVTKIREAVLASPTLDAGNTWTWDPTSNYWLSPDVNRVKTEKKVDTKIVVPATEQHPAQTRDVSADVPVGMYTDRKMTSELTAVQKSDAILLLDNLLVGIKQAISRANTQEVPKDVADYGGKIKAALMAEITKR